MWIERNLKTKLHKVAETRPVMLLTGARQTGKSSLLMKEFSDARYITFDHLQSATAATESPEFFLEQLKGTKPVILDEIQYIPGLFRALKQHVDKNRDVYGTWLLTGSQKFELMENAGETLAGRISILHLETLSAAELREGNSGFSNEFIVRGGYPELWANRDIDAEDFFESYMRTYIERDLRSIIEVRNLHSFQRFLRLLALRAGQLLNYSDIASDTGVSDVTIRNWISAMCQGGLLYLLPPYYANIGKRLVKSPKVYFADQGLLCHLLGIKNLEQWHSHPHRGHIWENVVMMELVKTGNAKPGENLFFYRDHNGVEIDFIAEHSGTLCMIEAKSSENFDHGVLVFKRVGPLLEKKSRVRAFVLHNAVDGFIARHQDFFSGNPLLSVIDIFSDRFSLQSKSKGPMRRRS